VRFGRKPKTLSPAAVEALQAYRWPGNVRELKNLIERMMILSPTEEIRREDLPAEIRDRFDEGIAPDAPLRTARDDFERRYILAALKRHRGNVSRTAEALDLERSNLYRKLRAYGIEVERE
jgi:two-component system nitrogen regulation response regulator NtrX